MVRTDNGRIDFEGLPNTRDLGGLVGLGGREVRSGVLLRSGTLYFASAADLTRLLGDYDLRAVIDLRGEDELAELPDPVDRMPQVTYLHADILKGAVEGISQNAEARARLEAMRADEKDPAAFMEHLYPYILLGDAGIEGYRSFLRLVLETTHGAVLWHCHFGRDRCGMASMLVQSILGVSMADIEADYMATNLYVGEAEDKRTAANLRFIRAAVAALDKQFGGVEGYVREALGLDSADLAELRGRYLA